MSVSPVHSGVEIVLLNEWSYIDMIRMFSYNTCYTPCGEIGELCHSLESATMAIC